ncbi:uncharacterized protein SAPINGB_P004502 [Magnusiomyces paraingens]|uniref:Acireductone dioxygenase n=1 Tax=Magnusiomyces paraingens TaxID=2606893 RepID=A0A5E8BZW9_9ASCO|nr:uncharacterized protein SAPINGB_P004502 [Saprochaete ingens]VVT55250.1 unnamed protein product [Saprochaete ingens]
MKAYYHDGLEIKDRSFPHESTEEVSLEELNNIGVYIYHFDQVSSVDQLSKERNYMARDEIEISPKSCGSWENYQIQLDKYYIEHLHEDEEIRYVLDGAGYFDIRNNTQDRWIRVHLTKGDLVIVPAGIYHRFAPTTDHYIKNMRLFQNRPKWMAINRPEADTTTFRKKYLKEIKIN